MDENFGLKFDLECFEIPPCAKNDIFFTEFVILDQNPHFYEVNQWV